MFGEVGPVKRVFLLWVFLGATVWAQASRPAAVPAAPWDMAALLRTLTSDKLGGRGVGEIHKTRSLLEKEFKKAGLKELLPGYRQSFVRHGLRGVNLVGLLPARGKVRHPGHLIISAHYDHLGRRGGKMYPGACDNASGVVAMLQIAHNLRGEDRQRDILFIAFDLEEKGLLGSHAYAARPLRPLKSCHFFITMDMLGRKGLGVIDRQMFVQGWEWTPAVLPLLQNAARRHDMKLGCFWSDVTGDRSDFVAFRDRGVPHLFFSVGENRDYHQPGDRFEVIDMALLKRQTATVQKTLQALMKRPGRFVYRQIPDMNIIEFHSLKQVALALAEEARGAGKESLRRQSLFLASFAERVIRKGRPGSQDRQALLRAIRTMLQAMR